MDHSWPTLFKTLSLVLTYILSSAVFFSAFSCPSWYEHAQGTSNQNHSIPNSEHMPHSNYLLPWNLPLLSVLGIPYLSHLELKFKNHPCQVLSYLKYVFNLQFPNPASQFISSLLSLHFGYGTITGFHVHQCFLYSDVPNILLSD